VSWIIVPFSRPDFLGNVRENFDRQTQEGKKLCIVENGDAVGHCKQVGFEPDMLLSSDAHPSSARNVGLAALRDLDAHFCCMDDDDWYGHYYQQEHILAGARGRITGKVTHWVHFEGLGKLWLFNRQKAGRQVAWVQGATVGGFARDVADFPIVDLGEELDLCQAHRAAGGDVLNTSVGHFVYMRRETASHLYQITPRSFANVHGPWFEEHAENFDLVREGVPPTGTRKSYTQV
jgi:hypothetical protein